MFRLTLSVAAATLAIAAPANAGRAVSLSDASYPPAHVALVAPGSTYSAGCFTEASAYRWNGSALSAQRRYRHVLRWGNVTYSTRTCTWRNHSSYPVLVAGWNS